MAQNPWADFLRDVPDVAYAAYRPQTGAPSFLNYWRKNRGVFEQDYLGALGQQSLGGSVPSLTQYDYLQSYPFKQNWLQMSPAQRGGQRQSMYSPRTRYTGFF